MNKKLPRRLLALSVCVILLLCACASTENTSGAPSSDSDALTWTRWNGFDAEGDGETYPYVLVTRGDAPLKDSETYRVAFTANIYTEEVGQTYNVQVEEGTLSTFVRTWLEEQGTVSPDGNTWE